MSSLLKDIFKIIEITIINLLIGLFLYPFLHELGHSIMIICFKAKLLEFNVFPVPYVLCDLTGLTEIKTILIGMAGNFFPVIILFLFSFIKINNFWVWLTKLFLSYICLLSFGISFISIFIVKFGYFEIVKEDDFAQLVNLYNNSSILLSIVCLFMIVLLSIVIKKLKPIKNFIIFIDKN